MKIKINNSFLVILALMIAINGFKIFIFSILCSLWHELGHIVALKLCKIKINQLSISAVGGKLYISNINHLSCKKQLLIYSLGIIFNFFGCYICHLIAINGFYSQNFFLLSGINFILGCFNLVPIFILDGYNILKCILNKQKFQYICKEISLFCNFLMLIFGIYLALKLNFSILLISIYLLSKQIWNLANNSI